MADKFLEISIRIYNEGNEENYTGWAVKDRYTHEYVNDGMPDIERRIALMIGKLFSSLFLEKDKIIEKCQTKNR